MKPAHSSSSARLVLPAPKKAAQPRSLIQAAQEQKRQRRQMLLPQAEELSRQNPGLHPQNAYEILLGHYTLAEWKARTQAAQEKRRQYCQRRREARFSDKRSEEEKTWCFRFFEAEEREPIWMETAGGDQVARVTKAKIFLLAVQIPDGSYRGFLKTEISALCGAALSSQVQRMRQINPEANRNVLPATKARGRWSFPHKTFAGWVGRQVQVQLINGSTWTGFLRWTSQFAFLLGAQRSGEPEVLLFKHGCCNVQPL